VASFAEQSDRTISDILRKMPGIEVAPSGTILYNDKPINRFYVEGLDLMGGRYGVITENLKHESVETIQVIEDHEPIKALEDVSLSEQAALNIILTEKARATWQTALKLGLGVAPLLWDNEFTAMRFAKNIQDVIVYKNNNIGASSSQELMAHYGGFGSVSMPSQNNLLNIPIPHSGISDIRSLFNNQHMITANRLIKMNDVYQLRVNADYLNDRHERNSSSHTVYFLDGTEIVTDEQTNSVLNINRTNLTFTLTGNDKKYFLENALNIQGDWSHTLASVSETKQRLKSPNFAIADNFRWLKVMGRRRIDIGSDNKFSIAPQALTIKPGLFADFFNDGFSYEWLKQDVELRQFTSYSSINFSTAKRRWQTNYELGFDMNFQHLNSDLSIPEQTTADTLRNEFRFMLARPFVAARYSYTKGRFTATLTLPAGIAIQQSKDQLSNTSDTESKLYLNPSLNLRYKMGYQWEISSSARYSNNFNTIRSLYTGYLLSDYRTISKNSGEFSGSNSQAYNLGLSYNEPIKSFNARIGASYSRTSSNMLPDVDFDGILSIRKLVEGKGFNDSKSASFSVSKGIGKYVTKATVSGSYSISNQHQQQQGIVLTSENRGYRASFNLEGRVSTYANCTYSISYNSNKSNVEGNTTTNFGRISRVSQNFRLNVFPMKALTLTMSMNHNQSITTSNLPSTFFADLRAQYKYRRFEFATSWNNIFNANKYVIANFGDFFSSVNTFELRPTNLVVSVRFSL
jgi:hypothetical protein